MTGSELRYDDLGSTAAAVELLRRHDAQEPEANITSAVRDFLTSTGLTKPEEIVEENPPSDSSRQAVDLTALDTFLELKQRIGTHGNPHPDHVAQLDGYLKQSEDAGRVRMGILTDGKHWLLRWPQAGPVRTVPPYLFTLESGDRWFRLYEWLKNQAFTALENISPDRSSLAEHFGPNAPALQRDIDALRDLYQFNRDRPTIQIKRQLWEDLLRTALGVKGGVGAALAQPGHQHLAGTGGDGQQRVIAPLAGVAVVSRPFLVQSVSLADGRIKVDGEWRVAGSRSGLPCPCQQLAAHPVQLADMAPPEAAQESAQGGGRLDYAAESAGRPLHGSVGSQPPQPCYPGLLPEAAGSWQAEKGGAGRVHAQTAGYTQWHAQTRLPLVRYDSARSRSFLLTFKTVAIGCSLFPGSFLFQNHYPRFRGAPSCRFRRPLTRPRSVDWGLGGCMPRQNPPKVHIVATHSPSPMSPCHYKIASTLLHFS